MPPPVPILIHIGMQFEMQSYTSSRVIRSSSRENSKTPNEVIASDVSAEPGCCRKGLRSAPRGD